jgi:hypothetical protein
VVPGQPGQLGGTAHLGLLVLTSDGQRLGRPGGMVARIPGGGNTSAMTAASGNPWTSACPPTRVLYLDAGTFAVRVASPSGSFSTLSADVTVTGTNGRPWPCAGPSMTQTIDTGGRTYRDMAEFDVTTAGNYEISWTPTRRRSPRWCRRWLWAGRRVAADLVGGREPSQRRAGRVRVGIARGLDHGHDVDPSGPSSGGASAPGMEERFEVLEGRAALRVDGVFIEAPVGTVVAVPSGRRHLAWNPTDAPVRLRVEMRPALRWREFTTRFFRGTTRSSSSPSTPRGFDCRRTDRPAGCEPVVGHPGSGGMPRGPSTRSLHSLARSSSGWRAYRSR